MAKTKKVKNNITAKVELIQGETLEGAGEDIFSAFGKIQFPMVVKRRGFVSVTKIST